MHRYLFYFFFLFFSFSAYSQVFTIKGSIKNSKGKALPYALIQLKDTNLTTYSNENGEFTLQVSSLENEIEIDLLGYKRKLFSFQKINNLSNIQIVLERDILLLDALVVTAKKKYSKEGTSSYSINNQSIKQIQAMDLGDVLSLLPGNKMKAPNLISPKVANLRSVSYASANSFGTSIILDGAVISNDANLQAINPTSSFSGYKSTVASGIDLRKISVANIESVEVITGVTSPKYGNLSSGAILVKSKVGASPWIINANISSTNYQASISKGKNFSKFGLINSDLTYGYSLGSPTEKKVFYQNVNVGLRWKLREIKDLKWNHFTSLRIIHSNDGTRKEPDEVFKGKRDVKSTLYQLGLSGDFKGLNGKINYHFNGQTSFQHSYFDTYQTNGPFPIIEALEPGTYQTTFSPTFFNQITDIIGQPIHLNGRLELLHHLRFKNLNFNFDSGVQYSYDDNYGKGRVVAGNTAHPNVSIGNRTANFDKIPCSDIFSIYHQMRIKHKVKDFTNRVNLGLRYDYMLKKYNLFSPRLSTSFQYKNYSIRGSWGVSYKAPAIVQLYPGKTFIDFINFTYYAENPKERLAVVTTHIHQPKNDHLKPSYQNLREIGLDVDTSILDFQLTLFHKNLNRGIKYSQELLMLPKQKYEVTEKLKDLPPLIAPIPNDIETVARNISVIKNSFESDTKGIEIVANTEKIKYTNTIFNFRYSYLKSILKDSSYEIKASSYTIGNKGGRFGVYHKPKIEERRSFGTLTLIQHIPSLRFVLTLSAEFNFNTYYKRLDKNIYPFAYYNMQGDLINATIDDNNESDFDDLILSPSTYEATQTPFFTNINLQIRKETRHGHSFSFFANNAPWYVHRYEEKGYRRELNRNLTVGFSFSLLIKNKFNIL